MQQRKNRGFTLIELVVVIVILGILAAFVLPRMVKLGEEAHQASVQATRGALVSGVNLVQAQWVAQGSPTNVDTLEGYGEDNLSLSANGWPVGTSGSTSPGGMNATRCVEVWQGVLNDQAPSVGTGEGAEYQASFDGTVCTYTYQGGGTETRTITYDAATGFVGGNNG